MPNLDGIHHFQGNLPDFLAQIEERVRNHDSFIAIQNRFFSQFQTQFASSHKGEAGNVLRDIDKELRKGDSLLKMARTISREKSVGTNNDQILAILQRSFPQKSASIARNLLAQAINNRAPAPAQAPRDPHLEEDLPFYQNPSAINPEVFRAFAPKATELTNAQLLGTRPIALNPDDLCEATVGQSPIIEYDLRQSNPNAPSLHRRIGRNHNLFLRHMSYLGHYENSAYVFANPKAIIEASSPNVLPLALRQQMRAAGISVADARVSFRLWQAPQNASTGEKYKQLNVMSHSFAEEQTQIIDSTGRPRKFNSVGTVQMGIFNVSNIDKDASENKKLSAPSGEIGNVGYNIHSTNHGAIALSPNNARFCFSNPNKPGAFWMVVVSGNKVEVTCNYLMNPAQEAAFEQAFNPAAGALPDAQSNLGNFLYTLTTLNPLRNITEHLLAFATNEPAENLAATSTLKAPKPAQAAKKKTPSKQQAKNPVKANKKPKPIAKAAPKKAQEANKAAPNKAQKANKAMAQNKTNKAAPNKAKKKT